MYEENAAKEELKRVDHLIYVTLKYTRTCVVIKNIIERLIIAFEAEFVQGLEYALKKKKIKAIPESNRLKAELLSKTCHKRGIKKYFELYYLLVQNGFLSEVDIIINPHPSIPAPILGDREEVEKQGITSGYRLQFPLFFRIHRD